MKPCLRVVATPIGNLGDLAPRAIKALSTSAVVLAEDTRKTGNLCSHFNLHVKLVSCHAHNELDRVALVLEHLEAGESVAMVTDAGAPAISDPGGRLVAAVVAAGQAVEVFPGPSAPIAALMGAGLDASRYVFLGFLPRKGGKRAELLAAAAQTGFAVVLFESPVRATNTLKDLHKVFGERRFAIARELTKLHETFHRGQLGQDPVPALVEKGELVLVVESGPAPRPYDDDDMAEKASAVLADRSLTPKKRAKELAKVLGISAREAYAQVTATSLEPAPSDTKNDSENIRSEGGGDLVDGDLASGGVTEVLGHLAAAARTLAKMAVTTSTSKVPLASDIAGADELMVFLDQQPLPTKAPVEAQETAKAILAALSAADALQEATEMMEDVERQRGPKHRGDG